MAAPNAGRVQEAKVIRSRNIVVTAALAAGAAFSTIADAHGFWFAERSRQYAMVFGVGADDLDMVKRMPKVTSFAAYDADGKEVPSKLTPTPPVVLVDVSANPAFLAATMDYGMWSKTKDGEWHEKGKDEVPGAIVSEKNYKYGVNIRGKLTKPMPLLP